MKKPNGVVLFEGKSLFTKRSIVVIATGLKEKTENKKTGNLIQTWILCKNIEPMEAIKTSKDKNSKDIPSKDKAVCGDCLHRKARSCYVNMSNGPTSVYKAYKNKSYPKMNDSMLQYFAGRAIRIGSYGDPAAVPTEIWQKLLSVCSSHTGYTHHWNNKKCDNQLKNICMASVDTEKEYALATLKGWRTFRTRLKTDKVLDREFICPASKEAGVKTDCNSCNACKGISNMSKTPVIIVHGPSWKKAYHKRVIIAYRNKKKYIGLVKPARNKDIEQPVLDDIVSPAIQISIAV